MGWSANFSGALFNPAANLAEARARSRDWMWAVSVGTNTAGFGLFIPWMVNHGQSGEGLAPGPRAGSPGRIILLTCFLPLWATLLLRCRNWLPGEGLQIPGMSPAGPVLPGLSPIESGGALCRLIFQLVGDTGNCQLGKASRVMADLSREACSGAQVGQV